jgi:tetratricopeptide (TPR) repeat protein
VQAPGGRNALSHLQSATTQNPKFAPSLLWLIWHHAESGNDADALLAANALVTLTPRCAQSLSVRAKCYADLDQPGSTKDDLNKAIELSPRDGGLYRDLAMALADLGSFEGAIAASDQADEQGVLLPQLFHYNLGNALLRAGRFEFALIEFSKAKLAGWPCDEEIAKCKRQQR